MKRFIFVTLLMLFAFGLSVQASESPPTVNSDMITVTVDQPIMYDAPVMVAFAPGFDGMQFERFVGCVPVQIGKTHKAYLIDDDPPGNLQLHSNFKALTSISINTPQASIYKTVLSRSFYGLID